MYIFLNWQGERAGGYGVALLNAWFSEHTNSNMLKNMSAHSTGGKNGPNSEAFVSTTQGNGPKKQRMNWLPQINHYRE